MSAAYRFERRQVLGMPCHCCGHPQTVEKVMVARTDQSDAFTSFLPDDLALFVAEASEYLGLRKAKLRSERNHPQEDLIYGVPGSTVLDLIYEARREGRLR